MLACVAGAVRAPFGSAIGCKVICKKPFVKQGLAFGCGQCLPCRIKKKRIWTHRIMLEATQHGDNCFLTLTYNDEHLPADKSLNPKHVQDFLKRLRRRIEPRKIRYFAVGEYGETTHRPHYHIVLFGHPSCEQGVTNRHRDGSIRCCDSCRGLQSDWSIAGRNVGNIYLGGLEVASAAYVSGYVTKKLSDPRDERLEGRHPEFARMSLRPGIGADFMDEFASTLLEFNLQDQDDVPFALRHGNRTMPIGRYLQQRLRERVGKPKNASEKTLEKIRQDLRVLHETAYTNAPPGSKAFAFQQAIIEAAQGKIINMESRYKRERKKDIL